MEDGEDGDGEQGGRVTGVRNRTPGGTAVCARARIVVGADGQHSLVACMVQAPTYHERPALTCSYYSYWRDIGTECLELHVVPERPALVL